MAQGRGGGARTGQGGMHSLQEEQEGERGAGWCSPLSTQDSLPLSYQGDEKV